jgi:GNAT superfamily N-acetyltransferase
VIPVKLPVLTQELALEIQRSETEYLTSRIQSIREREGNPEGVEIARFGNAAAFYIKTMPWGLFNSVKGARVSIHIEINEITQEARFDAYAEIHCLGSGMPLSAKPHFINNNIGLLNRPDWKLFLATLDGIPAGVAVMHISGTTASCTLAATVPEYRNRGIQTALLQQRLYEAYLADCRLVAAQASFGSTSQNNMERAGFQLAWTRSVWAV